LTPVLATRTDLRRHVARRAAALTEYLRAVAPRADAEVGEEGAGGGGAGREEDVVRFNVCVVCVSKKKKKKKE
jgi:hypothetical protein